MRSVVDAMPARVRQCAFLSGLGSSLLSRSLLSFLLGASFEVTLYRCALVFDQLCISGVPHALQNRFPSSFSVLCVMALRDRVDSDGCRVTMASVLTLWRCVLHFVFAIDSGFR